VAIFANTIKVSKYIKFTNAYNGQQWLNLRHKNGTKWVRRPAGNSEWAKKTTNKMLLFLTGGASQHIMTTIVLFYSYI